MVVCVLHNLSKAEAVGLFHSRVAGLIYPTVFEN